MSKLTSTKVALVVALLLVLFCGWLALRWAYPPHKATSLPAPNGYDSLLRAAEMLAPRTGWYPEMDDKELATTVQQNQPALALAREAFEKESAVPLDWSADQSWLGNVHLPRSGKLRELARAFAAAALLSHREGDSQSALQLGFDNMRLGQVAAKGGLAVDWLVGHAIYSMGLQTLRDQIEQLSLSDCQELHDDLLTLKVDFESPQETLQRDQAFFRSTHGALSGTYLQIILRSQTDQTLEHIKQVAQVNAARQLLLQTHVSIRRFQLKENRLPESLDELVPNLLKSAPNDPFSERPLIYRRTDHAYTLYSVGPDRQDDGGVEQDGSGSGDLLLEPSDYLDNPRQASQTE